MSDPVSRRDFVKTTAATVALPSLAAIAGTLRPHAAGSDTIKVGIIGCGGRGTGAAEQALRADKGCVLVAMSDTFPDRLQSSIANLTKQMGDEAAAKIQVPKERQFVGIESYQQVIDSDADVVLLTSYPAFRPAHLKAAVASGKHVFAEKPLGVDSTGMRSVYESAALAKQKNLGLLVGFCWRYKHGMRAAFDQVNRGAIGDVTTVHTTYHASTLAKNPRKPEWSDLEFQLRNWWHFTWISGDHIVEQAIHSVDRMAWAMNDKLPTKVTCLGGRAARSGPEHGNVYDHFAAIYEYDDGRRCFHTCRQIDGCPGDNTDYVYAERGSAVINGWTPQYDLKDRTGKKIWQYDGPDEDDMYQNEHDEFFKSIRAGTPINDCVRGANSCMMAIMARMAAYTGQTVTWEQAMKSTENLLPEKLEFGSFPAPEVAIPGKSKLA